MGFPARFLFHPTWDTICPRRGGMRCDRGRKYWCRDTEKLRVITLLLAGICLVKYGEFWQG